MNKAVRLRVIRASWISVDRYGRAAPTRMPVTFFTEREFQGVILALSPGFGFVFH